MRLSVPPLSVSPGRGSRSTLATRSRLIEPTTVSSGGKRAQVDRRALEVLAQVEQAGPERGAVRRRVDPGHVREALQGAHEHGELEIRLRDAGGTGADTCALQDRRPLEQLAGAGAAVPRPALRPVGLELEQVAVERTIEARQRRLRAVGRVSERRLAAAGCGRVGISAGPALEQAAEGERCGLAGAQLAHEPTCGRPLAGMVLEDVRPAGLSGAQGAHTSTTTGRIMGRRWVRS